MQISRKEPITSEGDLSKVLMIMPEGETRNAFAMNFKAYLNFDVDVANTVVDSIEILNKDESVYDLVVTYTEIGKEPSLKVLIEYFKDRKLEIPILSLGEDKYVMMSNSNEAFSLYSIEEPDDLREAIKTTADIFDIKAVDMIKVPTSQYYPIPIEHFTTLLESPADVFIKIGKGDSSQYIKRIHSGDGLDTETVERYMKSGVASLYVESTSRLTFVNALTSNLLKHLEKELTSENPDVNEDSISQTIQETVAKNIEVLGITPDIQKVCNKSMSKMIKESEKFPRINGLIERLMNNKVSFGFKHTQVTTYMAMAILKKIDWGKEEQEKTISFVSFFHDISLKNDAMAMIRSDAELVSSILSKKDKDLVQKHAQKSAEFIHQYPHMPMGADTIIRQHHGVLNGLGFSETFSGNLSPLTLVFIVAEECAHLVLKSKFETLNRMKILYEMEQKFKTTRFKKMLDALGEVIE